jgi:hypothetical protein
LVLIEPLLLDWLIQQFKVKDVKSYCHINSLRNFPAHQV